MRDPSRGMCGMSEPVIIPTVDVICQRNLRLLGGTVPHQSSNNPAAQFVNLNKPLTLQSLPVYSGHFSVQPATHTSIGFMPGFLLLHRAAQRNYKGRGVSPYILALAAEAMGFRLGMMRCANQ